MIEIARILEEQVMAKALELCSLPDIVLLSIAQEFCKDCSQQLEIQGQPICILMTTTYASISGASCHAFLTSIVDALDYMLDGSALGQLDQKNILCFDPAGSSPDSRAPCLRIMLRRHAYKWTTGPRRCMQL